MDERADRYPARATSGQDGYTHLRALLDGPAAARGGQVPGPKPQDPELLRRLLRARDRMTATPQEGWPVRRLAGVSGVSEAHFARSFKEAFGVPPHRYLLTLRIERAKSLLRDTDQAVTEVAFASGWRSLGTFGRTFHDVMGLSPSAYREAAQANARELELVPACIQRAAQRPHLMIAVSEKRRREEVE